MTSKRKPIEELSQEQRTRIAALKAWVIFGKPKEDNAFKGYVEHSWHLDYSPDYVRIWTETWNDEKSMQKMLEETQSLHPSWEFVLYEVHDPEMPFELDIEAWLDAQAYNPNTLSGVTDKFKARNATFKVKEIINEKADN